MRMQWKLKMFGVSYSSIYLVEGEICYEQVVCQFGYRAANQIGLAKLLKFLIFLTAIIQIH